MVHYVHIGLIAAVIAWSVSVYVVEEVELPCFNDATKELGSVVCLDPA